MGSAMASLGNKLAGATGQWKGPWVEILQSSIWTGTPLPDLAMRNAVEDGSGEVFEILICGGGTNWRDSYIRTTQAEGDEKDDGD